MESKPNQFKNDRAKVSFLMSYMHGKPLEWVSCLRRNNSPLLLHYYQNFVKELKTNTGDYTSESVVVNSKLCSLYRRKLDKIFKYIAEFQRIEQYSDFNESAKIYIFIKGFKQPLSEKFALVNPNPRSLTQLRYLTLKSLIKRNDKIEYQSRNEDTEVPWKLIFIG